jgi:hypothetical protein
MKKIALFIALIVILAGCEKDEKIIPHNIMLRGQTAQSLKKGGEYLTPMEISKHADRISFIATREPFIGETYHGTFLPQFRDTINGILMRPPEDILIQDVITGEYSLTLNFITAKDIVLSRDLGVITNHIWDTIAYIPNSVMQEAYNQIQPLFQAGKWQDIYDTFNNAFVFLPITGEDYRNLVKQGIN